MQAGQDVASYSSAKAVQGVKQENAGTQIIKGNNDLIRNANGHPPFLSCKSRKFAAVANPAFDNCRALSQIPFGLQSMQINANLFF
jgi:hypothetical protein